MKIEVKNLSKSFKENQILDNVSITFSEGKIYGLAGRNGSGKSVFLKIITGLYAKDAGTILYNSKWNYVNGFIAKDTISLNIINYDELLITESLQKKKFLFFKLPISIFGYKQKILNVISKNPNTKIISTEYITVKKP